METLVYQVHRRVKQELKAIDEIFEQYRQGGKYLKQESCYTSGFSSFVKQQLELFVGQDSIQHLWHLENKLPNFYMNFMQ